MKWAVILSPRAVVSYKRLGVLEENDTLVTSETVLDECVYVHLRKMAAEIGIKNIYDLPKELTTVAGKDLLNRAIDDIGA